VSNEMTFHIDRTEKIIFGRTMPAYEKPSHMYKFVHQDKGSAIQSYVFPKEMRKGSPEHIIWLFFTDIMTYRNRSLVAFKQCVWLYENYPEIFSDRIIGMSVEKLAEILRNAGLVHPNENAFRWKGSGETLFRKFGGNPIYLFAKTESIDDFMKMKMENGKNILPGLGPKLASLLALFYEELDLIPHIKGAFPVDVHIMAQFKSTKRITFLNRPYYATDVAETIRKKTSEICYSGGMKTTLRLSHADWFRGELCYRYCKKGKSAIAEALCPVFDLCDGRSSTKLYRMKGMWNGKEDEGYFPLLDGENGNGCYKYEKKKPRINIPHPPGRPVFGADDAVEPQRDRLF
jgi:hypothetical protein